MSAISPEVGRRRPGAVGRRAVAAWLAISLLLPIEALGATSCGGGSGGSDVESVTSRPAAPAGGGQTRTCCKVCSSGKACGNSCIARNLTCHKGAGCACDAR